VLGAIVALRHHPKHALGQGVTALMLLLTVGAILAARNILPHAFFTPLVVALLAAFPVLVIAEGLIAPIELLSTVGNILSYARVMAIGTASVMMAVVANRMTGMLGSVVVGTLFGLIFHMVNFALGLFSPTIHALRLHYVEFFGKFYSPGGTHYRPFGHGQPTARHTR
jgi:V/A-type H+-transporting ATPase subunit I